MLRLMRTWRLTPSKIATPAFRAIQPFSATRIGHHSFAKSRVSHFSVGTNIRQQTLNDNIINIRNEIPNLLHQINDNPYNTSTEIEKAQSALSKLDDILFSVTSQEELNDALNESGFAKIVATYAPKPAYK